MKIALVTETFLPSTDGVVTRLLHAIDYMLDQGHELLIIAPDIPGLPANYKEAKVVGSKAMTFFFYKQRPWAIPSPKVKKFIKDFNPDIVHAVNPLSLAASGVWAAKKLDIPLIASFHTNIPNYVDHYNLNIVSPFIWKYIRYQHNSAPVNLVTSNAMYELLDSQNIHGLEILPKGVDIVNRHPNFYSEEMRDHLTNGQKDKKLLIFVGRVAPEKAIHEIKPLLDRRDDLCLAIVGDGPSKEDLEDLYKDSNVIFTGFLHGEELSQAYASADAFIFPSTSETLGLVITESMASGTPVIAAYSEPTAEQITHRVNGFIYEDGSIDSMEDSVNLLENRDLIQTVNKNARTYAEQFSWENASKAIVDAYEETIQIYLKKYN